MGSEDWICLGSDSTRRCLTSSTVYTVIFGLGCILAGILVSGMLQAIDQYRERRRKKELGLTTNTVNETGYLAQARIKEEKLFEDFDAAVDAHSISVTPQLSRAGSIASSRSSLTKRVKTVPMHHTDEKTTYKSESNYRHEYVSYEMNGQQIHSAEKFESCVDSADNRASFLEAMLESKEQLESTDKPVSVQPGLVEEVKKAPAPAPPISPIPSELPVLDYQLPTPVETIQLPTAGVTVDRSDKTDSGDDWIETSVVMQKEAEDGVESEVEVGVDTVSKGLDNPGFEP